MSKKQSTPCPDEQEFGSLVLVDEFYQVSGEIAEAASVLEVLDERANEFMFDTGDTDAPPANDEFDADLLETAFDSLTLEDLCELYPPCPSFPEEGAAMAELLEPIVPTLTVSVLMDTPAVPVAAAIQANIVGWLLRLLIAIARRVGGTVGKLLLRLLGLGRPIKNILEARKALQAARGLKNVPDWAKQIFIRFALKNYRDVLIKNLALLTAELAGIALLIQEYRKSKKEAEEQKKRAEELQERIKKAIEDPKTNPETKRQLEELDKRVGKTLEDINKRLQDINGKLGELEKTQEGKQAEKEKLNKEIEQEKEK